MLFLPGAPRAAGSLLPSSTNSRFSVRPDARPRVLRKSCRQKIASFADARSRRRELMPKRARASAARRATGSGGRLSSPFTQLPHWAVHSGRAGARRLL
jgi:hypothetical protein